MPWFPIWLALLLSVGVRVRVRSPLEWLVTTVVGSLREYDELPESQFTLGDPFQLDPF